MILFPPENGEPHIFNDATSLPTGKHPFATDDLAFRKRHNQFDKWGRWVGDDLDADEDPCRCITRTVADRLQGQEIIDLFIRYERGDYGTGEAGFAVYTLPYDNPYGGAQEAWIIDDAVRSPEGEPPARPANLSPGPQTLMFPEDY